MNPTRPTRRPAQWDVLAQGLREKRPVLVRYHGTERLLCPHVLGWKNGRPKVLSYQASGTTSHGPLPQDPRQRWRSMFVDEINQPTITDEPWETAQNYNHATNAIDDLEIAVELPSANNPP